MNMIYFCTEHFQNKISLSHSSVPIYFMTNRCSWKSTVLSLAALLRKGTRGTCVGLALTQPQETNSTTWTLQMMLGQAEGHTGTSASSSLGMVSLQQPTLPPEDLCTWPQKSSPREALAPAQEQTWCPCSPQAGQALTLVLSFPTHNHLWSVGHYHPHWCDWK